MADAIGADEVYVIWPVHRSVDDAEKARLVASISRPSMNAQFSIFYVYLPEMQASHNTYVGVHKSSTPGESRMIAFVEEGDSLEIQIDAEISRHIRQALADTRI